MKIQIFSQFQLPPGQTCCPCPKWTLQAILDWGLGAVEFLEKIQNFQNTFSTPATTCSPLFFLFREMFGMWFAARD
jgi:hypothetical protein